MHEVELSDLVCLAPRPGVALVVCLCGQMGRHLWHKHCVQVIQIPAQQGSIPAPLTRTAEPILAAHALRLPVLWAMPFLQVFFADHLDRLTSCCTSSIALRAQFPSQQGPEAYHMFSEAACILDTPKSAGSMGRRISMSESSTKMKSSVTRARFMYCAGKYPL